MKKITVIYNISTVNKEGVQFNPTLKLSMNDCKKINTILNRISKHLQTKTDIININKTSINWFKIDGEDFIYNI